MRRSRGMLFFGAAVVGVATGWVLAGRHIRKHRTALFSPRPLQRLSALAALAAEPSIANVRLLRDTWLGSPAPSSVAAPRRC